MYHLNNLSEIIQINAYLKLVQIVFTLYKKMILKKQDQQVREWDTIIGIRNLTVNIFS